MSVVVVNYSMNPRSLTFGHQRKVVEFLSRSIPKITVITADSELGPPIDGVRVISTKWEEGKKFASTFRFVFIAFYVLFSLRFTNRRLALFSHMTDLQSCLLAVPCKILGIRHVLWYAHKKKSAYLRIAALFVDCILTSTRGSMPINSKKVVVIGQAIDSTPFREQFKYFPSYPPLKWYSIGRIDPSKNLESIINVFSTLRDEGWNLTLDIFGAPSSKKFESYANSLFNKFSADDFVKWLSFKGKIQNHEVPTISQFYDGFIHAYEGSLDKVLIEATMARRVVVTNNREYLDSFEVSVSDNFAENLITYMRRVLNGTLENQELEVNRKFDMAQSKHSMQIWIGFLTKSLFGKG